MDLKSVDGALDSVHCVFNVKKRSWKGGVQVEIVMEKNQITRLEGSSSPPIMVGRHSGRSSFGGSERISGKKSGLTGPTIVFSQASGLHTAGYHTKKYSSPGDSLVSETDELVQREAEEIKRQIYVELDLVELKEGFSHHEGIEFAYRCLSQTKRSRRRALEEI